MKRGKEAEEGEVESTCRSPDRRQTPFSRTCSFAKAAVPALTMDLASPFLPAVGCHVKNSFDQGFDQGFDHFIIGCAGCLTGQECRCVVYTARL